MNTLQNLHTHSTYCDGKDTVTEMIEAAISKGFGDYSAFYRAYYKIMNEPPREGISKSSL